MGNIGPTSARYEVLAESRHVPVRATMPEPADPPPIPSPEPVPNPGPEPVPTPPSRVDG
jgi:hypothetical protein